jgi:hypothetical protein
MSLYLITMPVLIQTSTSVPVLLRQCRDIFDKGHIQGPALAIFICVTYCYAAWARTAAGDDGKPFIVAAALTMGIVPYTWIFMWKTNTALFDAVEQSSITKSAVADLNAKDMIGKWCGLHGVRSLFPLASAVVGFLVMLRLFWTT